MQKVSIRPVIYSSYRYKDGTYPVKFRVLYNQKQASFLSNVIVKQNQLTSKLKIRDPEVASTVENLEIEFRRKLNKLPEAKLSKMDIYDVVRYITDVNENGCDFYDASDTDFIEYGERFANSKIKTAGDNYRNALKAMKAYSGLDSIPFSKVNSAFLVGMERFLVKKHGAGARAVSLYMGHVRTIHYLGQREFNVPEEGYYPIKNPFVTYKVPRPPAAKHRDMDKNFIQEMINNRKNLVGAAGKAVDAFLLSFCLMGMNSVDMYECLVPDKWILHYCRHKTRNKRDDDAEMYVRIPECIRPLYEKYKDKDGVFAFSFNSMYSAFTNMSTCLDRGLRIYKNSIGFGDRLSMYSARHSWATLCYQHCLNRSIINDGLAHVSPGQKVTDIYIKRSYEPLWETNEKFLNEVFDWSHLMGPKE